MDILVRMDDSGALLIGDSPAAPAGIGLVLLRGAEAIVDPTAPGDPPHLVVHDLDDAGAAVALLYGEGLAAAAARVLDGAAAHTVSAQPRPAPAAAAIRELGLLRWLESSSPDRLPAGLFDLHRGTAAAVVADLLEEVERERAAAALIRRAGLATAAARRLRDEPDAAPAGLAGLIGRAIPELFAELPMNDPGYDAVVHEYELVQALRALGAGVRLDWSALAGLPGVAPRALAGASDLGATVGAGVDSVDWHQVPAGVLDTAEESVTWTVTAGDPARVRVVVRAAPAARTTRGLAFRLYGGSWPLPIGSGVLTLSADGAEFTGEAPLTGPVEPPLTVDVCTARDARSPRLGPDRVSAQANRWTVRAVTALRLAGPASGVDSVVRAALQQAANQFRLAAAQHPVVGRQELAQRRRVRCFAVLRALLEGTGATAEAARLTTRFGTVSGPVLDRDVTPPDLAGPGWSPLAVETAVAADESWGWE